MVIKYNKQQWQQTKIRPTRWHACISFQIVFFFCCCADSIERVKNGVQTTSNSYKERNLLFFKWQYQTESKRVIWFVVYFRQKCSALVCRCLYLFHEIREPSLCMETKERNKKNCLFLCSVHLPTSSLIHRRRVGTIGCTLYLSANRSLCVSSDLLMLILMLCWTLLFSCFDPIFHSPFNRSITFLNWQQTFIHRATDSSLIGSMRKFLTTSNRKKASTNKKRAEDREQRELNRWKTKWLCVCSIST